MHVFRFIVFWPVILPDINAYKSHETALMVILSYIFNCYIEFLCPHHKILSFWKTMQRILMRIKQRTYDVIKLSTMSWRYINYSSKRAVWTELCLWNYLVLYKVGSAIGHEKIGNINQVQCGLTRDYPGCLALWDESQDYPWIGQLLYFLPFEGLDYQSW